jgi:hypothetical protein
VDEDGMADGADGEEAAWRDLIANYAAEPARDSGDVPWPERENLACPRPARPLADVGPDTDPAMRLDLSDTDPSLDLGPDLDQDPSAGPAGWDPSRNGAAGHGSTGPGSAASGGVASEPASNGGAGNETGTGNGGVDSGSAGNGGTVNGAGAGSGHDAGQPRVVRPASPVPPPPDDEEDFVPPVPPPLPTLDPVAKGAWAALLGGPGYLLVATMVGWAIPGWAAFLAVAAFVGGLATLVIRMGDKPPRDSGPGDGAVL